MHFVLLIFFIDFINEFALCLGGVFQGKFNPHFVILFKAELTEGKQLDFFDAGKFIAQGKKLIERFAAIVEIWNYHVS